jgi:hypothetical protein
MSTFVIECFSSEWAIRAAGPIGDAGFPAGCGIGLWVSEGGFELPKQAHELKETALGS